MILIIDTTKREIIKLGLANNGDIAWQSFDTTDQSADILPAIDNILRRNKILLKDIKAIAINQGQGSFTGVRVGIAVANTLAWSLNIPVLGYRDGKIVSTIAKIKDKKFSQIVLPSYPEK